MKSPLHHLSVFFTLLFLGTFSLQAQSPHLDPCGYTGKSAWLEAYQNGEIAIPRSVDDSLVVGVKIHLVGTDLGGGFMSLERLMTSFRVLQNDFNAFGVYLYIYEDINYIANSDYYEHDFAAGRQMMSENNVPNAVNCYIVESPAGNCGYYTGSRDAVAVAKNCMDPVDRTWSHELGHFFSLPHTFVGWEGNDEEDMPTGAEEAPSSMGGRPVEKADSSNCEIAADGFCDTPADYLAFRWPCTSARIFADSLRDPDSVRFVAYGWPIMSYASDACVAPAGEGFSPEQSDAMVANMLSRGNLDNETALATEAPPITNLIYPLGEDIAPVDELAVDLVWEPTEGADFYIVQINRTPFFGTAVFEELLTSDTTITLTEANGMQENRRYYWRIIPLDRYQLTGEVSEISDFRILEVVSATNDPVLDAGISVFPNPAPRSTAELVIRGRDLPTNGDLQIELRSAQGRLIQQAVSVQASNYRLDHQLDIAGLAAGVYFIRFQQSERMVTKRVIIGN